MRQVGCTPSILPHSIQVYQKRQEDDRQLGRSMGEEDLSEQHQQESPELLVSLRAWPSHCRCQLLDPADHGRNKYKLVPVHSHLPAY